MLGSSHWCHEISLPKSVPHRPWLRLISLAKNTLLIHINWFMGMFIILFLFLIEPYSLAHQQFFWNIEHSPMEAPLSTPSCKIETNLFVIWEFNFRQTIWDKTRCYWDWERLRGTTCEPGESQGNMRRTYWEHIGNKEEKQKKKNLPPPHPQREKKKNRAHHECMLSLPIGCMKFLFPKLLVTIFGLG